MLQVCASFMALAQVILGTLILSSLIFVGFHDTLVVLARFLSSAMVSRAVALLHLTIMKDKVAQHSIGNDLATNTDHLNNVSDVSLDHLPASSQHEPTYAASPYQSV